MKALAGALLLLLVLRAPPVVVITTSAGVIKVRLDPEGAPATTANFLRYVGDRFYDGTIFNRVIAGFVVQGGGYGPTLALKPGRPPIRNEGAPTRRNLKGTIAMAHGDDPHGATSHFFINVRDNRSLDWQSAAQPGFCVFGQVIAGLDVVQKIARVPTSTQKGLPDVPTTPVVIESVVLGGASATTR
jgi:cyclophilin family peptidyl-prolyl cis-trans isomerase